jgi:hypothetical protein
VTNGGVGLGVRRLFGSNVTSGALYFSALLRINNLGYGTWNGAASQVGAFAAPDNASFRLQVMVRSNTPSSYVIGVQKGGSGATATFSGAELRAGDTVLLAGKYDFSASPNAVHLWINPSPSTFGAAAEPSEGFITATTGPDGFAIDRFNFRQNTAASVPAAIQWDELRVGLNWSAVTPAVPPILTDVTAIEGVFKFSYSNISAQTYTVFTTSNLLDRLPAGVANQISPALYEFSDAVSAPQQFYQLRSP